MIETALWIVVGFFLGSLPFSVWVGRLALRKDIRVYGDGNPGASNVLRAGGWGWGVLAFFLDYLKGAIPVGLAYQIAGFSGWPLVGIALAPVFGHAFSPFLRFRGGKAMATTLGIWTGLTIWQGPIVLGLGLGFWFLLLVGDGWAVLLAMLGLIVFLTFTSPQIYGSLVRPPLRPDLLAIWLVNFALVAWKYRADLARRPGLRPWLRKLLP